MSNTYKFFNDTKTAADRARAEQAAASIVTPSRRLYVFGGADGTFPYFATFADARTYVNALTPAPSTSEPVSIFLLSASDGTPIEITGPDDWYALCLDGIYVSSPYRDVFSTTTLPTTLPKGMQVLYADGNGVETLWVGNDAGVAVRVGPNTTGTASGQYAVAEGNTTTASGEASHAEGNATTASGYASHAEGSGITASGYASHAEGLDTTASEEASHAEGSDTTASGFASHAEGASTTASGSASHAEGAETTASEYASHAEGELTIASGEASHAEGVGTAASGDYSHAEGQSSTASGARSHAEGQNTVASGEASHAEGVGTAASGDYSHAEGAQTTASGDYAHAEGFRALADKQAMHAHGNCTASGNAQYSRVVNRITGNNTTVNTDIGINDGEVWMFTINVSAVRGTTNFYGHTIRGCIRRNDTTTALVGAPEAVGTTFGDAITSVTASATTNALRIAVAIPNGTGNVAATIVTEWAQVKA